MKLGVLTVPFGAWPLEKTIEYLKALGVECLEIGCGGFPGSDHLDPRALVEDKGRAKQLLQLLDKHGMEICALSCHGNPVHPNAGTAKKAHQDYLQALEAAALLGVGTVVTFSGCPGDHDGAKYPNWVTCAWPDDYGEILRYQWEEKLVPYWREAAATARKAGVGKIALEMHPGFCVYNPYTLLKLREAAGEEIGANFDPSHLYWQGIDPVEGLKALKGAVYHFHAKDTAIDIHNTQVNGVLDTRHYGMFSERAWSFRTVGYGHGGDEWKRMLSTLRLIGYDGAVSIEHEDGLMSITEGMEKAVAFLKDIIIREQPAGMWWA